MRLTFRVVGGAKGDRYPEWVAALDGKSGCYVIRRKSDKKVLYVGESHTGNLRKTLVRHFELWRRNKKNKEAVHDWSRHTGQTYERGDIEVAYLVVRRDTAQKVQFALIQRLSPRDNDVDGSGTLGDLSDVPF